MLHPGALTQKPLQKKIYLVFWKAMGVHRNNFFHATDVVEAGFIRQVFGDKANVFIAGNFSKKIALQVVADKKAGEIKLLSIALISAMKNIDLVLDALKSCRHSICYQIYGPIKDEAYWLLCLSKIKQLPLNVKVIYKGAITPLQIEAALLTSAVFILPSKSENFGHAIFEALSAGKPVITSRHTPFNKLAENYAGKNVSVENSLEMTAAIDSFAAMGQAEFAQWNIGAYQYANAYSDDALLQQQYDSMFLNTGAFV
ncbi:MAG: glycosyltransferase [Aquabacterium sp.]|nr:glycosyltransferase [Ferruginibacter sp.]